MLRRQDFWQVMGLLFFGAELDQHGRQHVRTEGHDAGRIGVDDFLVEDMRLNRGPVRAAMFFGPMPGQPTFGIQQVMPFFKVLAGQAFGVAYLFGQRRAKVDLQEGANLLAESLFFGSVVQVHWGNPHDLFERKIACWGTQDYRSC